MDAIEQLFASQVAERKAAVLEFTPDEIRITAENKFDDDIYQLLYDVWKETSGEYDPKDDKPIVDPRGNVHTQNETKFKYWAMEQYGMTAEEYRGYTFKGTGKTVLETVGAYFKVTAPIDAKKGITYLVKNGVTPKNILKAAFGMTDDVVAKEMKYISKNAEGVTENVVNSSLRELMSPEEVARYDEYWLDVAEKTSNEALEKHIAYIKNGGIKKPTGGKFKPAKVSAAVDLNTGNIYIGYNGSNPKIFNPSRTEIVHELQQRIEYTKNLAANTIDNEYASRMSFQMWSVDNCAEIYAVNNLLKDGGDINNIFINTKYSIEKQIDTYLKTALPCKNCQITFEGCFFAKK
ncbi:hypothetical protein AAK894_13425 [Lachnospiraceae bacterium 46-61]